MQLNNKGFGPVPNEDYSMNTATRNNVIAVVAAPDELVVGVAAPDEAKADLEASRSTLRARFTAAEDALVAAGVLDVSRLYGNTRVVIDHWGSPSIVLSIDDIEAIVNALEASS